MGGSHKHPRTQGRCPGSLEEKEKEDICRKTGVSALLTPESPPKTPGKTPASLVKLSGIHPGVWTGVQTGDSGPTGDSAPST